MTGTKRPLEKPIGDALIFCERIARLIVETSATNAKDLFVVADGSALGVHKSAEIRVVLSVNNNCVRDCAKQSDRRRRFPFAGVSHEANAIASAGSR